jgi:GDPmannose 4,6-dehydratase
MLGQEEKLLLGNLDAKRDWGYAPEFVEGMWRILQTEKADDFVLATNETHTVREFVEKAFKALGEDIVWQGEGVHEKGILKSQNKVVVEIDPRYFRPTEVDLLIGDYGKAKKILDWYPKTTFEELVKKMTLADFNKYKSQQ